MMTVIIRRLATTILFLGIMLYAASQVIITPQIPPTGLIKKDQLWNIVLVSNNEAPVDVQLQVSLQDLKTGQKVLTGAGRMLTVTKGARQIQINDVTPVQYNYGSAEIIADRSANGLLPVGAYQLCYTLIAQSEKNSPPAQEDCMPVEVQPLSPPQLNAPVNKDTVLTKYPLFEWIPPAPLTLFTALQYEFVLVEVNKGQQAADAVQKNTPVYFQRQLKTMFLSYPALGKPLEEGKTYAWQVIAKNGNNYTEKTESWEFTVKKDSSKIIADYEAYPALKQGTSGGLYICQGKVSFSYNNENNDSTLDVQFYRQSDVNAGAVFKKTISIVRGRNYTDLVIHAGRIFQAGEAYIMECINSRKEKWTLEFKYKPVSQ